MAKALNDIVQQSRTLADAVSKKLAKNAPIKSGKLREALREANTLDTMLEVTKGTSKLIPVQTITFTLDYAPDKAPYGMFWNEPTLAKNIKNGKTKNIPSKINYAEKTLQDAVVVQKFNKIYDLIGDMIVEGLDKELDIKL